MINKLRELYDDYSQKLNQSSCKIELFISEVITPKRSGYIDVISSSLYTRFALWDTGECEIITLDISSMEQVWTESAVYDTPEAVEIGFHNFINKIGCL